MSGWHLDAYGWPVFETPEGAVNYLLTLLALALLAWVVGRIAG
jgi:hypothetical protein